MTWTWLGYDAGDDSGGPTLYSYPNRTPVSGDLQAITVYLAFITLFLAFLIIFPGVRKEVSVPLFSNFNF